MSLSCVGCRLKRRKDDEEEIDEVKVAYENRLHAHEQHLLLEHGNFEKLHQRTYVEMTKNQEINVRFHRCEIFMVR
jgi:hypothetical protein